MLLVSCYGETSSTTFPSGTSCTNGTVTQSWLIYLWISEVRTGLPKSVVIKQLETLEFAGIYVSIWSTLGTTEKHVTQSVSHRPGSTKSAFKSKVTSTNSTLGCQSYYSSTTSRTNISKSGLATIRNMFNLGKSDRAIWKKLTMQVRRMPWQQTTNGVSVIQLLIIRCTYWYTHNFKWICYGINTQEEGVKKIYEHRSRLISSRRALIFCAGLRYHAAGI